MSARHFVSRDAEAITRHSMLELGWKEPIVPTRIRVVTLGHTMYVQGDPNTVPDWRGSSCAPASSITGCRTSWKKSMSASKGASAARPAAAHMLRTRPSVPPRVSRQFGKSCGETP